jgi:hypothetical protein
MDLITAVGGNDQHSSAPQRTNGEPQQITGRRVGPVQIFDHEDEWTLGRRPLEKNCDNLEQSAPAVRNRVVALAQLRKE